MSDKLPKILKIIMDYIERKKSCQIRINLHEGNLSEKVEVKESLKIE